MGKLKLEEMLTYLGIEVDDLLLKTIKPLMKGKEMGENELAELLDVKINSVRKALYKLSTKAYVSYSKSKSKEKKWWYVYSWKLDMDKIKYDYIRKKNEEIKGLKSMLAAEEKNAFYCSKCGNRSEYIVAMDADFLCECGEQLKEIGSSSRVIKLRKQIAELENEVEAIE